MLAARRTRLDRLRASALAGSSAALHPAQQGALLYSNYILIFSSFRFSRFSAEPSNRQYLRPTRIRQTGTPSPAAQASSVMRSQDLFSRFSLPLLLTGCER